MKSYGKTLVLALFIGCVGGAVIKHFIPTSPAGLLISAVAGGCVGFTLFYLHARRSRR